ncbi:SLC13 family permease [Rhizobium mongolense]|uniref:Di/tricarboxylate transporter n=2 Tax=Rhizobium mongolense TaxID=57676 RepID=A0ABR6IF56_9HYPH|nr:SLC13 family permease [Rhizobium mongolense]MBB4226278.1 di/tricarboxylate transporter [Rhizobium mongolense]TVZ73569.1 di/tricarboxylate transporter [Rhizobium mongolense USDA 1844]
MTQDQAFAFAILIGLMVAFIWGRFRYDLIASLALLAAVFTGIVPHKAAFSGFGDDIVIIVASALVVSAAIERSGVIEALLHRVAPKVTSLQGQVVILVGAVTVLSTFIKNIGALSMMIPVAFQMARRSKAPPSSFLMPMAFGSLLGGLITLVGTSPNIVVSQMREELTGRPFNMFDFTPVGIGIAAAGVAFLAFGYRLLPRDREATPTMEKALNIKDYMTEARVTATSLVNGKSIGHLSALLDEEVLVTGLVRNQVERMISLPDLILCQGDIVLLEGDPQALERGIRRARLELEGHNRSTEAKGVDEEIAGIEVVIGPKSVLIGQTAKRLALHERFNINLLAVSRSSKRFTERLRDIALRPGDVLVLKGDLVLLPTKLMELGLLPLAGREIRLGNPRRGLVPVVVLAGAMALTAFGLLPVATAFFTAAVLTVLLGSLSLREAYEAIDWPILIMLGALIPVSESIRTTGGADLIAGGLAQLASALPLYGALAMIMVVAMAATPFLNNAATVLVVAPIAVTLAQRLGYSPDAFLMAVAVGAACDFLTPVGHQCNTLVLGPGGYRFGDYWKLGLPLSSIVVLLGVPLILLFWPPV